MGIRVLVGWKLRGRTACRVVRAVGVVVALGIAVPGAPAVALEAVAFVSLSPTSPGRDPLPVMTGTAPAGSSVTVYSDVDCLADATAAPVTASDTGGFVVTLTTDPARPTTSYYGKAIASDGTETPCSFLTTYELDTVAPAAPTLRLGNPGPANANSVQLLVGAEAGAVLRFYRNDATCATPFDVVDVADLPPEGLSATVPDNSVTTFGVTATDRAGNASACSFATYTEDSASRTPRAPDLAPASDTGDSNVDDLTSVTLPTFIGDVGSVDPSSTVVLFADGVEVGRGQADADGGYAVTATVAFTSGISAVTARATDPLGNVSALSAPLFVEVDASSPVWQVDLNTDTGYISPNGDGRLDTLDVTLRLSKVMRWTWRLEDAAGSVRYSASGDSNVAQVSWAGRDQAGLMLPNALYTWHFSGTDRAGNVYTDFINDAVRLDTVAPGVTTSVSPTAFNPTTASTRLTVKISAARADEDVFVTVAVVNAAGTSVRNLPPQTSTGPKTLYFPWDGRDTAGRVLASGSYTFVTRAVDPGKTATTNLLSVRIDTIAPRIGTVTATPNPFKPGVSSPVIAVPVSEASTVTVDILSQAGVLLRRLPSKTATGAVTVKFTWDGRKTSSTGAFVGKGLYEVRVRAVDWAKNSSVRSTWIEAS
ncbi:MAG TPA: Ig-like domain-containing protein [Intrasporangium sp.]|uniref:FlgD immunoglobulin-like domain containing protein n=1 Tax=Intrasporangium sp. TaxID=1925024 RepID=UPI002D798986|nr:Ig-like domain-containing protein [Intrasporangium sp.]HET7397576.1 Ig-like domain-containing protein [Intrasporangium sp.]